MEARGNNRPTDQALKSEINVTPLVDVMLVVLIIFMVVTPLLQAGVSVDLPPARNVAAAAEDQGGILTVVLQADGRMFLGTDPIDPGDLTGALRHSHMVGPDREFQVKADRNVPYGEIKRILQAGRAAGFRGAALIAREVRSAGSASPVAAGD